MADQITAAEYLIINGTPSATPAWRLTDLTPLWTSPPVRGEDRIIPGVDGRLGKPRHDDALVVALPGVVWGTHDREGVAYGNHRTGLHTNLAALKAAWLARPATDEGTVAATWVIPGTDKTADLHVVRITPRALSPRAVRIVVELNIPSGGFA